MLRRPSELRSLGEFSALILPVAQMGELGPEKGAAPKT
jgi:hypothetical protein